MRVCFVSQAAYGLFNPACGSPFGGAELQAYVLATTLAEDPSFEVDFLVQDHGQPRVQRFNGVTVRRYSRPFKTTPLAAPVRWTVSAVSIYTALGSISPDVCVGTPAGFATAVAAVWVRLHRKARFVFRLASDADLDGGISRFRAERAAAAWAMRSADLVVAQSVAQRDALARRHGLTAALLPNAIRVPASPPALEQSHVLWVASAQNLKQPEVFLRLARAFPEERFQMVMPSNDRALFERIRADALGIPNVDFWDGVPLVEIQRHFDRAKILVNTSTTEGFPNTFLQAAIAGVPVLSLNIDPDGVLSTIGFGRCARGDRERLRADLRDLLADSELRQRMGRAGFEYAKHVHDINVVAGQFKDLLAALRGHPAENMRGRRP
jgi:glycosyltransferase involved in cell wall biosynthesis